MLLNSVLSKVLEHHHSVVCQRSAKVWLKQASFRIAKLLTALLTFGIWNSVAYITGQFLEWDHGRFRSVEPDQRAFPIQDTTGMKILMGATMGAATTLTGFGSARFGFSLCAYSATFGSLSLSASALGPEIRGSACSAGVKRVCFHSS